MPPSNVKKKASWDTCTYLGCFSAPLTGSKYCRAHLSKGSLETYREDSLAHAEEIRCRPKAARLFWDGIPDWKILHTLSKPNKNSSMSYAIGLHRVVKVGYGSPATRLMTLQIGNHRRLRLLANIRSQPCLERFIHKALFPYRIRGEWFRIEDDVRTIIRAMNRGSLKSLCQILSAQISASAPDFFQKMRGKIVSFSESIEWPYELV